MFKPVQKTKRNFELVMEQIHELMIEGVLKPGDRLCSERELAEKLQVSRTSIREALRILEALEVVQVKPGEGTFLRKPSINSVISPLSMFLYEDQPSFKNIYETRMMFEASVARLAAERRSDEDLMKMEQACLAIQNSSKLEQVIEADFLFHMTVLQSCKNPTMLYLGGMILQLVKHGIQKTREVLFHQVQENQISAEQHFHILEAIKSQNSDEAYRAMYHHLKYTADKAIAAGKGPVTED